MSQTIGEEGAIWIWSPGAERLSEECRIARSHSRRNGLLREYLSLTNGRRSPS